MFLIFTIILRRIITDNEEPLGVIRNERTRDTAKSCRGIEKGSFGPGGAKYPLLFFCYRKSSTLEGRAIPSRSAFLTEWLVALIWTSPILRFFRHCREVLYCRPHFQLSISDNLPCKGEDASKCYPRPLIRLGSTPGKLRELIIVMAGTFELYGMVKPLTGALRSVSLQLQDQRFYGETLYY